MMLFLFIFWVIITPVLVTDWLKCNLCIASQGFNSRGLPWEKQRRGWGWGIGGRALESHLMPGFLFTFSSSTVSQRFVFELRSRGGRTLLIFLTKKLTLSISMTCKKIVQDPGRKCHFAHNFQLSLRTTASGNYVPTLPASKFKLIFWFSLW